MSICPVLGALPTPRAVHPLDRRPALVGAAFNTFLIPLLGIIFLPFATLIYVLFYTPGGGLPGWEWLWVLLAGLLDIGHWGASYTQRNQIPGVQGR